MFRTVERNERTREETLLRHGRCATATSHSQFAVRSSENASEETREEDQRSTRAEEAALGVFSLLRGRTAEVAEQSDR